MKRRAFLAAIFSVVPLTCLRKSSGAKVVIPDGRKYPIWWTSGTRVSHKITYPGGKHEVTAKGFSSCGYSEFPKVPNGFCRTLQEWQPIGDSNLSSFEVIDLEI